MQSNHGGGVTTFFKSYEKAIKSSDPALMSQIYGESFLFGGPSGSQSVKLEDFLRIVPQRAGFMKSLGLTATCLKSLESAPMDDHYTMVRVVWEMQVEKVEKEPRKLSAEASYILQGREDGFRIVAQIDHQDLIVTLKGQ